MKRALVDGAYPHRGLALQHAMRLAPGVITTCFAFDAHSGLSSPMQRALAATTSPSELPPRIDLSAPAGRYEWPLQLSLSTSERDAMVVYTTDGTVPDTGSPLYQGPIAIASTLSLPARAISADGRRSPIVEARYEIDQRRSLQRQLEDQDSGPAE
ncbi:MAG: chitobiase/beta-hexosaminidase C-terminal domain-containing protein [Panacagrimonas sp.]